jgi:hypothetical protein
MGCSDGNEKIKDIHGRPEQPPVFRPQRPRDNRPKTCHNYVMKIPVVFLRYCMVVVLAALLVACYGFAGPTPTEPQPLTERVQQDQQLQAEAIAFAETYLQKAYAGELEDYWPKVQASTSSKEYVPAREVAKGYEVNSRLYGAVTSRQFLRIEPDPPVRIFVVFETDYEKASAEETIQLVQEEGQWKIAGLGMANVRQKKSWTRTN